MAAAAPWSSYKYKAFISYSHDDAEITEWLENSLESFKVPREIVGKWTPVGPAPNSLRPVFRDRSSAAAGSSINATLLQRLDESACLIVVCSPSAAKSRWVNEEILHFKRTGRAERIFAFIVDGEPSSGGERECFPPALRHQVDANGDLTEELATPLAADARKAGDGRRGALIKLIAGVLAVDLSDLQEKENQLQRRQIRMARATAGVMAALFAGCSVLLAAFLDVDRKSRLDVSRIHARAAQIQNERGNHVLAAMLALTSLPAGEPSLFGTPGGSVRVKPRLREAEVELARAMMASRRAASFPAHASWPFVDVDRFRKYVASHSSKLEDKSWTHELRLHRANGDGFTTIDLSNGPGSVNGGGWSAYSHFYAIVRDQRFIDVYFAETGARILSVEVAGDGEKVWSAVLLPSFDAEYGFNILTVGNGAPTRLVRPSENLEGEVIADGPNRILAAFFSEDTGRLATRTADGRWQIRRPGDLFVALDVDAENSFWITTDEDLNVVAAYDDRLIKVYDANTGELRGVADFSEINAEDLDWSFKSVEFSPDGKQLAVLYENGLLRIYDTTSMELLVESADPKMWTDRETVSFLSASWIGIGLSSGVLQVYWTPTEKAEKLDATRQEIVALSKAFRTIDASFGGGGVIVTSVAGEMNLVRTRGYDRYSSLAELRPDIRAAEQFRYSTIANCNPYNPVGDRLVTSDRVSIESSEVEIALRDEFGLSREDRKKVAVVLTPFAERSAYLKMAEGEEGEEGEAEGEPGPPPGPEPKAEIAAVLKGHSEEVESACFSPAGDRIVTIAHDAKAIIWDGETYEKLFELDHSAFFGERDYGNALMGFPVFTRAGDRLAVIDGLHRIHVWDLISKRRLSVIEGQESHADVFDFLPDGERIVIAENAGTVAIRDVASGARLKSRFFPGAMLLSVKASPSGDALSVYDLFHGIFLLDSGTLNTLAEIDQLEGEFLFQNRFISDEMLAFVEYDYDEVFTMRPLISERGADLVELACGRMKGDARLLRYPAYWTNGVISNEADGENFAAEMNGLEWTDPCREAGILSWRWWSGAMKSAVASMGLQD